MNKINKKLERVIQTIASLLLFIAIGVLMLTVKDIQGTARVINYAGLVRGSTQRMVKLEISGIVSDEKIEAIDKYIDGLKNGSNELNLIKIEDKLFQEKVDELITSWRKLKNEVRASRLMSYKKTNLMNASEDFFEQSDDMVGKAEAYSEELASKLRYIEFVITTLIIILTVIIIRQTIGALNMININTELTKKAFKDSQTGLPNKNACEQIIGNGENITVPKTFFMFDLNNLKVVNDTLGHDVGDRLITEFSTILNDNLPQGGFLGRYGGDEFIAIIDTIENDIILKFLESVRLISEDISNKSIELTISYAVGYVKSLELNTPSLRDMLNEADKRMYINKRETKKKSDYAEERLNTWIYQMISALQEDYIECYYCDAIEEKYRVIKNTSEIDNTNENNTNDLIATLISRFVTEKNISKVRDRLNNEYIINNLSEENNRYKINCGTNELGKTFEISAMYVNKSNTGLLHHFMINVRDISEETKLLLEAKTDGLTGLTNKNEAYSIISDSIKSSNANNSALLIIDIDDFKCINDTYGHLEGDMVLKSISRLLEEEFSDALCISRYGGDEFLVYIENVLDKASLKEKCDKAIKSIFALKTPTYKQPFTASMGISFYTIGMTTEHFIEIADEALFSAKYNGKNRCYTI